MKLPQTLLNFRKSSNKKNEILLNNCNHEIGFNKLQINKGIFQGDDFISVALYINANIPIN